MRSDSDTQTGGGEDEDVVSSKNKASGDGSDVKKTLTVRMGRRFRVLLNAGCHFRIALVLLFD